MKYRRLGRTALSVSEIGFGGGGIGGVWGETTVEESIRAVRTALDLGVNFFDVAPGYGDRLAERVLGEALGGHREDVLITTKVVLLPDDLGDVAAAVRASVQQSLTELQTDYVDLLLVHNPLSSARGRPYPGGSITAADALEMAAAFEQLRTEGLIRFTGFTAWRATGAAVRELVASDLFDVLQTELNLLNHSALEPPAAGEDVTPIETLELDPEVDMVGWSYRPVDQHQAIRIASDADVGVICIRPLLAGILSDEVDRPGEANAHMDLMRSRAAALSFLTEDGRRTLTETAFQFCLAAEGVSTVIPGVKNVAEIEDAIHAAQAPPLTAQELDQVKALAVQNFGVPALSDSKEA